MPENAELAVTPGKKCPLSGAVVTAIPHEDWIEGNPYRCHVCGALVTYRVRETDYAGHARLHTHKVPRKPAPTGLPTHARGDGWLTACGQDRANVVNWTDDPNEVTCPRCLDRRIPPASTEEADRA